MRPRLEAYLTRVWYRDARPPAWLRALVPLYRLLARSRWRRSDSQPPVPVIVVGNITVGGSGKTPVVAALARHLREAGRAPAVISRGYGGQTQEIPRAVSSTSDPDEVGDEPVMLARQAGVPVWVCADRAAALAAAVEAGAGVVLADDGLQHPRLPRSYELCVIDGLRGLGNGWILPAGPLRQPSDRLERVDQILVKRTSDTSTKGLPARAREFAVRPGSLYRLGGGAGEERAREVTFDAVCAIGNPDSFFSVLEAEGIRFRPQRFPDHHRYRSGDIGALKGPVVTTEKDAVKLEHFDRRPEIWVLPIEADLPEDCLEAVERHVREFRPE